MCLSLVTAGAPGAPGASDWAGSAEDEAVSAPRRLPARARATLASGRAVAGGRGWCRIAKSVRLPAPSWAPAAAASDLNLGPASWDAFRAWAAASLSFDSASAPG